MEDDPKTESSKLDRRNFGRLSIASLAAVVPAIYRLKPPDEEIEGLQINGVVYVPLYERHDQGPDTSKISAKTSAIFIELNVIKEKGDTTFNYESDTVYSRPAEDIARAVEGLSSGRKELIEKAKMFQLPLAFGDVLAPVYPDFDSLGDALQKDLILRISDILLGPSEVLLSKFIDKLANTLQVENPERLVRNLKEELAGFSKRSLSVISFLGKIDGVLRTIRGMGETAGRINTRFLTPEDREIDARLWFLSKFAGYASHTNPLDFISFQRNLLFAYKAKVLAERQKHSFNTPVIAVNVGAGHSGFEDLLHLPTHILKDMIGLLYKGKLRDASTQRKIDFVTTRIIRFTGVTFTDEERFFDKDLAKAIGLDVV